MVTETVWLVSDKRSWYPYYKIIPDLHETEVYHLEPGQIENISSEITVETDDNRLITSLLTDVKCQYKVIKNGKTVY